jgi:hypothetical protein
MTWTLDDAGLHAADDEINTVLNAWRSLHKVRIVTDS